MKVPTKPEYCDYIKKLGPNKFRCLTTKNTARRAGSKKLGCDPSRKQECARKHSLQQIVHTQPRLFYKRIFRKHGDGAPSS